MLTYLEGTRYKLQSTLLELDHKTRGTHPLAPHIQLTRDRHGLQQSILKVPLWFKGSSGEGADATSGPVNDDDYVNRFIEPMTPATDVRNEAVIGGYNSRIHSDLASPCEFTAQSLTDTVESASSRTTVEKIKSVDDIDRGIADGGSNQQDSDFGKLMLIKMK